MKKYLITAEVISNIKVDIEAATEEEAIEIFNKMYRNNEIKYLAPVEYRLNGVNDKKLKRIVGGW